MDKLITDSARVEISYDHYALMHGRANLTTNTRISPNTDGKLSSETSGSHEEMSLDMATTF
jgi:hypothetical protein